MASISKSVEFTPLARQQLLDITDYIVKEFGYKSAEKFISLTERHLQNIADGKIINRYFLKSKQIRYFISNRKNYILYQELKKSIRVVGVYNMAQDTKAIKRKLRE